MISPTEIGIFGALLALGIPAIGSGYAMQRIGELAESLLKGTQRGLFTNSLIFSVLAETPTIYGLLVAILILMSLGRLNEITAYGAILAGLCVALPGIAAAYAIGLVSQASLVAIHEKKSLFGKTLILAALPEAISIYGLIISLLILSSIGAFGETKLTSAADLEKIVGVTIITALSGIVALFIGRIAVNAVKSLVYDEGKFTQALIIAVLPESLALYAFLVSILILSKAGLI